MSAIFEILKVVLLGIVEGITEWLPISSTGDLILVDEFIKLEGKVEFKNVDFRYADEARDALNGLNLDFYEGQFTCVLGHHGSGKSTMAKLINALEYPTNGSVITYGYDTADEKNEIPIRRKVGMVFQNPDNQIVATVVEEDVAFGPENLGVPREEIRKRVDEALKLVNQMKLAVKSADDSVDVGNIDKKADRLVVEISEVDELVIDNRCTCFEKLASVLCIHRFDT